jgi:hypothetical protein
MGGLSGAKRGRFQTGGRTGAPRRTGALHGSIIGDPSSGEWTEHFPAIGQNPIYSGWGRVTKRPGGPLGYSTVTNFNNQNLPYPNRPPGGGYSGGVVPRFQEGGEVTWQNATPEQWAALNRPAWAPEGGAWSRQARRDQHLAARGLPPSLYTGANKRYLAPRFRRGFSGPPVPPPPGGGYSGGVIPRFQAGGVPVGAERREYVKGFLGKTRAHAPIGREWDRDERNRASHIQQAQRNLAPPRPRGWQGGGAVGYSHGGVFPRHGSVTEDPTNPGSYSIWKRGRTIGDLMGGGGRSIMPTRRRGNYNFNRSELYPNWSATGTGTPAPMVPTPPGGGYSGGVVPSFQTGGQLEDPLYPVESELADESPWYPDEEVGFEEAAPMQGGFDIFGRSGG